MLLVCSNKEILKLLATQYRLYMAPLKWSTVYLQLKNHYLRGMAAILLVRWHYSSFSSKIMNEMCDFSTASKLLLLGIACEQYCKYQRKYCIFVPRGTSSLTCQA